MMNEFYAAQLEFIQTLQQIRSPIVDDFFKFFDFFDKQPFLFILIPAIWIGYNWKVGLRLFYILIISGLVNYGLKELFGCPRPFHIDPNLGVIQVSGYGFPSGAAQTAVLLSGILLSYFRNKWSWLIAINFVFWVSLARVYLGVHFPTDILGGWAIGLFLWALFTYVRPVLEKEFESLSLATLLMISQLPFILLMLAFPQTLPVIRLCSVAMGAGIGVFVCSYYRLFLRDPKSRKELIMRAAFGIGSVFIIYGAFCCIPIHNPSLRFGVQFFILGLWLSLGATLLWRSFKREAGS